MPWGHDTAPAIRRRRRRTKKGACGGCATSPRSGHRGAPLPHGTSAALRWRGVSYVGRLRRPPHPRFRFTKKSYPIQPGNQKCA